jgi:beta-lactamase class A
MARGSLWIALLPSLLAAADPAQRQRLDSEVRAAIVGFQGTVSLYAKNLDTGETFGIKQDARVRTASTIKLPIMAATFAAVAQGKVTWDDQSELREDDKISGSGILREFSPGIKIPLRDLVHLMIVVSDNTATNLVLDRITADYVNAEMDKLGLKQTRSLRKVLGKQPGGHSREGLREEFQRFGLGVSTPFEMVALIEKIERGEVVSPEASRQMLEILGRQQFKDAIGRRLPGIQVASKSGSLDKLRSDVGLVRSAGGRIAIAVTVDDIPTIDWSPENAGSILISKITGYILEGLSAPVAKLGTPEKVIELEASMDHVQGIEVDGDRPWVSWVDRNKKTGHLGEFNLSRGELIRSVEVHKGSRYHPGGIARDGSSIWIPVAEYKPLSSALIQRRSLKTLALESEFTVTDHIGCVAAVDGRVYGGNWDSKQIYMWDTTGKLISKRDNPSGTSFQDMKAVGGRLIGAGRRGDSGAIDWLDAGDLRLVRRIQTGSTDRNVVYTNEGMTVAGDRLYLLPEDSPSRLFVFAVRKLP